jgi:hypothetical protein
MAFASIRDSVSYQKVLRSRMRDALMREDYCGCWGRLLFSEVCHTATTFDSHDEACLHDEFKIAWLGQGPKSKGALPTCDELEATLWSE